MAFTSIKVGIISKAEETSQRLRAQVEATRLASVKLDANEYCSSKTDPVARRFAEAKPDIIVIDLDDASGGVACLGVLHAVLPRTWLLVSTSLSDSQFLIEAVRAGAREFLPKPITPASLTVAFRRFVEEVQQPSRTVADGKIYCVAPAKSGSGATTVAVNLAMALAEAPDTRVVLIDMGRPLGDAAAYLNLRPKHNITDVLRAVDRLDSMLLGSYTTTAGNLAVVAAPEAFHPGPFAGLEELPRLLDVAARTYTHTVVDLPIAPDPQELQVFADICAQFLLVMTPELPSVWRAGRLLRFLDGFRLNDRLCLVLNRTGKEDPMDQTEIQRTLERQVFWRLPNDYQAVRQAISTGRAVVSLNGSPLSRSCRGLAQRISGLSVAAEKRRGLFGLFAA
jgi:pilus assembly protein CpaE